MKDRKEKDSKLHHFKHIFILSIIIYYMEIILRINTESTLINIGLLYSYLIALAVSATVHLIGSFFSGKRKTVLIVLIIFVTYLYASQMVYFNIFRTFYSVYSAAKAFEAIGFINDLIYKIVTNIHWIILMTSPSFIYLWVTIKNYNNKKIEWISKFITVIIVFALIISVNLSLTVKGEEQGSSSNLNVYLSEPIMSVNRLGLVSTMSLDLYKNIFDIKKEEEIPTYADVKEIHHDYLEDEIRRNKNLGLSEQEIEYNMMDINFDELIENENDKIVKNMHQYFSSLEPSEKNKYTGKFENYNLIFITAESYHSIAVDKEITPTLYKMQNEGYNFTNFYNPLWGVSTLDGEYVATTGLLPKSGVWSMYESRENYMPYAMGNRLREEGYTTLAYHNHFYTYYDRHLSHPNLGYEYIGLGNGLDVEETWPESDLEMVELTADEYMGEEPFHTYYLTMSGHMRYNFGGNDIANKNRELVEELTYGDEAKAYMATQIELDKAMEYLLKKLEKYGVAENTLIVMSPDHYPYGLEKESMEELAGRELENNFEIYKSSLIIYSKDMEPKTIEKPVSSLDIIPTIMNLMGLEYDSRLLMGRDVFSNSEPLIIFNNRSFITDEGRYNSVTGKFIPNEGIEVEENYVETTLEKIERKFYYSEKVLDNDYYSLILE